MNNAPFRILFITGLTFIMFVTSLVPFLSSNAEAKKIEAAIEASEVSTESTTEETETIHTIVDNYEEISEEEFLAIIESDQIDKAAKSGIWVYATCKDGSEYKTILTNSIKDYLALKQIYTPIVTLSQNYENLSEQSKVEMDANKVRLYVFGGLFVGSVGILLFAYFYTKHQSKQAALAAPTSSKEDSQTVKTVTGAIIPKTTFDDVEGIDELKRDVTRIVNCLKDVDKYKKMGAKPPKGMILYGPPGTGKTLIAKAIAGEAGVPFLSAVGSDFVEEYVGRGAKRIRELYAKAKKNAPCIVFIDEVDAVAGKRGDDNNGEHDQTLNALLAELDGFNSTAGVITICATNRLDMLDDAFKRAGRFDLKLAVSLPDKNARKNILNIHGKNKPFDDSVDFDMIAHKTVGFSGAELEALLNEAALLTADRDKELITSEEIDDAFFKIVMQGNKKARSEVTKIQYITAYHEAGHALATKLLTNDEVPSVTIVQSSSGAGGVTFRTPSEEGLQSKEYLRNTIKIMYAGRAAEEIYLGTPDDITTGASNDIEQATSIIKQYIGIFGMGNMGMLDMRQFSHDFKDIIEEATELSKELYEETIDCLRKNKKYLDGIALELVEKETLDEKDINRILEI